MWKMMEDIWAEERVSANSLDSLMVFFQLFSTHKYFGRITSDHVSLNGKGKRKKSLFDSDQNEACSPFPVQFSSVDAS